MAKRKQIGPRRPTQSKPLTIPPDARLRQGGTRIPGMNVMGREAAQMIPPGSDMPFDLGPFGDLLSSVKDLIMPSSPEGIAQAALPIPGALGVTAFLNKGVPDVATRQINSKVATEELENLFDLLGATPEAKTIVMDRIKRYPRVMAHTSISDNLLDPEGKTAGRMIPSMFGKRGTSQVRMRAPNYDEDPLKLVNTFMEELYHSAQNIGMKDRFQPSYWAAHDALGYDFNPFELSAKRGAQRRAPMEWASVSKGGPVIPGGPVKVTELLKKMGILNPETNKVIPQKKLPKITFIEGPSK